MPVVKSRIVALGIKLLQIKCGSKKYPYPMWRVIGNSEGGRGLKRPRFLKEGINQNWNFQKGGWGGGGGGGGGRVSNQRTYC